MLPEEGKKTIFAEIREIFRVLIISLLVVIPVRFFIAQPFIVRGASMEPNFHDGQYLIIDELGYRFREPERGQVIVFRYPNDPSQFFIKRVIGLPGETVVIQSGKVEVRSAGGGKPVILPEGYLDSNVRTFPDSSVTLHDGEYFVLGDNRTQSSDSRYWGILPYKYIVGKVLVRLWPPNQFSIY